MSYYAVPFAKLAQPETRTTAIVDEYWMCHPELGALFWRRFPNREFWSPQCNTNKVVTDRICMPGFKVVRIPLAFLVSTADGFKFDERLDPVQVTEDMIAALAGNSGS